MQVFAQINKVDVAKREVWGRAAQEFPDHSGEIMDYETSKPLFEEWSSSFQKASEGKSMGNVRSMHGNVAAGKVISLNFDDVQKSVDIGVKVVDDNEWAKVLEGVHTGFSIGGKYVKKWVDGALTRYTASPSEISLVDRPCIPTATFFDIVKADGVITKMSFKSQPEEIKLEAGDPVIMVLADEATKAIDELAEIINKGTITPTDLIKLIKAKDEASAQAKEGDKYGDVAYADTKNEKYPIDTEVHIRAAWNYIHKAKNAAQYFTPEVTSIKNRIISAWKKIIDKDGPPSAAADHAEKMINPHFDALTKGLYQVSNLAQLIETLSGILQSCQWETDYEADNSPVPESIRLALTQLSASLVAMAQEETKELLDAVKPKDASANIDPTPMAMAIEAGDLTKSIVEAISQNPMNKMAEVVEALLGKIGSRNSKDDQEHMNKALGHVKAAADHLSQLGASAHPGNDLAQDPDQDPKDEGNDDGANATDPDNIDTRKSNESGDLLKGVIITGSTKLDGTVISPEITKLLEVIAKQSERLTKLESQPMPMPSGNLRVVGKGEDGVTDNPPLIAMKLANPGEHSPESALALIKASASQAGAFRKF